MTKDSRFYDGYIWCSDDQKCRIGLCIPAETREEAAKKFIDNRRRYWNLHKKLTVWTMLNANDNPTPIEV